MTFKCWSLISVILSINSCNLNKKILPRVEVNSEQKWVLESKGATNFISQISVDALKKELTYFASDDMEGRSTGEEGQRKAANYLKEAYQKMGIGTPKGLNYFQNIPEKFFNGRSKTDAVNVMGFIPGTEKPEEVLIISAHYDHIGINTKGEVFNGADDDGSGTIGILQIAKAFQKAFEEGKEPRRSILFLHVVGEEIGLYGSKYYTENPIFNLKNTIANLNIDMIGRVDDAHLDQTKYLYIIGSDKLSKELHFINEAINKQYSHLSFDYTFNDDNDPNRFYYRSDHYNFAKNNIPVIFYFNGIHKDYHNITDTVDKIDFPLLKKRCEHIFLTAWELANRKERIQLN